MIDYREYPVAIRNIYFQLKVTNLERAKRFYENVFNFEVSWYEGTNGGWCEFFLPGRIARLGLNPVEKDHQYLPNSGVLTFDVPALETTKKYLESKNIETSDIIDVPNLVSYFQMKDSEGNTLQIISEPRVKD
jgi:predicted enzyme related to lactoylglutathione lyase